MPNYAGFRRRLGAWLLDMVLAWSVCVSALLAWSGIAGHVQPWDAPATPGFIGTAAAGFFLLGRCLDAWLLGTPGKRLLGCLVVDARSGQRLTCRQSLWRGVALLLAALPAGLGIFLIGWSRTRQGLHDRLAGTVVIMEDEARQSLQPPPRAASS